MSGKLSVGRVIALLTPLAHGWPDNLILYSHKGRLYLVNRETGRVYWSTLLIHADGGADAVATVDERGNESLDW